MAQYKSYSELFAEFQARGCNSDEAHDYATIATEMQEAAMRTAVRLQMDAARRANPWHCDGELVLDLSDDSGPEQNDNVMGW